MTKSICLSGQKFGRLFVGPRAPNYVYTGGQQKRYVCKCECGNYTIVRATSLAIGHTKSCGCWNREVARARVGPLRHNWTGGRKINQDGYVQVLDKDHPNADALGYVLEHRKVMANAIGRPLREREMVHHINGNRQQNDLANLELCAHGQPPGQRVADLVKHAKEVLATYEPAALVQRPVVSYLHFSGRKCNGEKA